MPHTREKILSAIRPDIDRATALSQRHKGRVADAAKAMGVSEEDFTALISRGKRVKQTVAKLPSRKRS
jgi:hypothetical protein